MKLELISRLKGNEVLGKNIFTEDGKVLLRAGTELNFSYISRMKDMGIYYVYVEDDRLSDVIVEDENVSLLKQTTMKRMSDIMKNTSMISDKTVMGNYVKSVEELITYIGQNADINKSIYDIQTYSNTVHIHSVDVCIMSTFLAHTMRMSSSEIKEVGLAAILHDIGKTQLPKSISEKIGNLTDEELKEFKKHSEMGADILKKNIRIPNCIVKAVRQHHERFDGKGYPDELKGNGISKYARIINVSDVYDTVTHNKYYKKSFMPSDAYELILAGSGTLFDDDVVKAFRKSFAVYPLGTCVKLSNGVEGYVVRQNENFPDRPVIRVIYHPITREDIKTYEIDLFKDISVVITSVI